VALLERDDFCSPLAGPLSLQCGGLTPLWLCLSIVQNARLPQNESGVKPPHSKTAQTLRGGSTQNKNRITEIGLDKYKLNTPRRPRFVGCLRAHGP
jgi:hypothetical protein